MLLPAADFVRFRRSEFEKIPRALGFSDQVNSFVVVFENRPVRVVFADGGIDFEPAGKFHEQFNVLAFVEIAARFGQACIRQRNSDTEGSLANSNQRGPSFNLDSR